MRDFTLPPSELQDEPDQPLTDQPETSPAERQPLPADEQVYALALAEQPIGEGMDHAVYTLRGPGRVQPAQADITFEASIVNNRDEPLGLRACICPAGRGAFIAQKASLLETGRDSAAFTRLMDGQDACVQGILWKRGDRFVWELVGDVGEQAADELQTRLTVEASYLANKEQDEWLEISPPTISIATRVKDRQDRQDRQDRGAG
jgi:hypothetical protein